MDARSNAPGASGAEMAGAGAPKFTPNVQNQTVREETNVSK